MIFRKFSARSVSAPGPDEAIFPRHSRLVAAWRRDARTGRLTLVWKSADIQDHKRAA